jgi:hypothetical protein
MGKMSTGDILAALQAARDAGLLQGGPFGGIPAPPFQTGHIYAPHFMSFANDAVTLTANRLYRTWFYVHETTTFLGGWFFNSGAGDNTKKVRIGIWDKRGALKKDFGETTLNGSSLIRQAANTVTLPAGWYQIGLVSDTAPALYAMSSDYVWSNVGHIATPLAMQFGTLSVAPGASSAANVPDGDYAPFTYGALPDPITAATVTILNTATTVFPLMGLYL